jgi:hypothetical protein
MESEVLTLGTVETFTDSQSRSSASTAEGDWLCAWCLNRVANERDRFQYEGKDEFSFANPAGVQFDIILFSQTLGCRETGVPTLDYTWFAGHAWSFCQCDRCGHHLGWYYAGQYEIAGLIKSQIVRALHVRN